MIHRVFSYGTLRLPAVQEELFGRAVPTNDDALPGFRLEWVTITDPAVVATSGTDRHPILRRDPAGGSVAGAVLELGDADLAAADAYEVDDYRRIEAVLASGARVWVYVASDGTDASDASGGAVPGRSPS